MHTSLQFLQRPGLIALYGTSIQVSTHRHHAVQLSIGIAEPLSLSVEQHNLKADGILVAADTAHAFDARTHCLILLMEPESHLAQCITQRYLKHVSFALLPTEVCSLIRTELQTHTLSWDAVELFLRSLHEETCPQRHLESRIAYVLEWIDSLEQEGRWERVTLSEARGIAHLSESRFLHLFVEQMGLPWRRYVRWRRLLGAVMYASKGASLTESAHHAGFSDSAHFSRVFREMFGINPRAIVKQLTS